ncbi:OLC1v1031233C1 [Oldenlandia corymbosa var. corymbosa]|uniref:OLC1v1031233C1 n=1 Tax=Oldenlandia corymbosa var. corymbosa TaxID=529605 RepID=A0AAV1CLD0_OLDCO|nr:OLC1v1031233C1 [Oldenlandia corymbosa var. corymbosa]
MENWCYHRETLISITKHYESGETLPEIMYEKLVEARTFGAGTQFLMKLGVSSLDLELHTNYVPGGSETVIDLEHTGFDNEKAIEETEQRFRETILGFGGGKTASQVYLEFRGREPSLEALIRHNG